MLLAREWISATITGVKWLPDCETFRGREKERSGSSRAILMMEFLEPLGISQYRLAKEISVPPRRINEIVKGSRAMSDNTALRLARYFGTTERYWLNIQSQYDLETERDRLGSSLQREVHVLANGD